MSLLTGMCAARIMLDAGVGLLRTLPPAPQEALAALRKAAEMLGIDWQEGASAGVVLAGLPSDAPETLAMMTQATRLLRGADYAAFDGKAPALMDHSGIAAPYAHVTAPLRRLSDRFATEGCRSRHRGAGVGTAGSARSAGSDAPIPFDGRQCRPSLYRPHRSDGASRSYR